MAKESSCCYWLVYRQRGLTQVCNLSCVALARYELTATGGTYRAIDSPILSDFPIEADLQSLSLRSAKIYFPKPIEVIFIHSSL